MYVTNLQNDDMCKTKSGNKIYWMITTERGAPNFEMRYIEIPAGGKSSYGHHSHEHEVYVVRGEGAVRGKESQQALKPGVAVFIPGDEEHQWVNSSTTEPLGFICIVPKGAEAESKPPC